MIDLRPSHFLWRWRDIRQILGTGNIGLLTIEQTRVHLGHIVQHEHRGVHAHRVREALVISLSNRLDKLGLKRFKLHTGICLVTVNNCQVEVGHQKF